MNLNTLLGLFVSAIDCSTKWRGLTNQTETQSLNSVNRLKTQPVKFISGLEELKGTTMKAKLDDPSFNYINSAESDKPGYLLQRMELYRRMIESERQNRTVRNGKKDPSKRKTSSGQVLSFAVNGK